MSPDREAPPIIKFSWGLDHWGLRFRPRLPRVGVRAFPAQLSVRSSRAGAHPIYPLDERSPTAFQAPWSITAKRHEGSHKQRLKLHARVSDYRPRFQVPTAGTTWTMRCGERLRLKHTRLWPSVECRRHRHEAGRQARRIVVSERSGEPPIPPIGSLLTVLLANATDLPLDSVAGVIDRTLCLAQGYTSERETS